jgi:hypothetical protein
LEQQQKILLGIVFCVYGASPKGDRLPIKYCNCGKGRKTLTYSAAKSTASPYNACPYTTDKDMPTVTFSAAPTPAPTAKVTCHSSKDGEFTKDDGKKLLAEFCSKLNGAEMKLRPKAVSVDWDGRRWWKMMEISKNKKVEIGIVGFLDDSCADLGSVKINKEQCKEALSKVLDGW